MQPARGLLQRWEPLIETKALGRQGRVEGSSSRAGWCRALPRRQRPRQRRRVRVDVATRGVCVWARRFDLGALGGAVVRISAKVHGNETDRGDVFVPGSGMIGTQCHHHFLVLCIHSSLARARRLARLGLYALRQVQERPIRGFAKIEGLPDVA